MTNKKENKNKNRPLTLQLITAFFAFAVLVLALLWLFQTVFLDDIYRTLKLRDIDNCADSAVSFVSEDFTSDSLSEKATELSKKYGTCLIIYEIKTNGMRKSAEILVDRHVNTFCFIHNLSSKDWVNRIYNDTVTKGGKSKEWVSLSDFFGAGSSTESGKNVVESIVVNLNGKELLLLFNAELAPLSATTYTLRIQLLFISIIVIIAAFILALILSAHISRPIRKMSKEASKLALGDYNVNFDGGNCTETENLSSILNSAANELSRLDKMQKDLIANVSHDLRTPLTMIEGYTEAMRDLPGEANAENLQIVIDETKRLTALVNDMMEVTKYQVGMQTLNKNVFNFTAVVRTTLDRYAKLREKDGYKITFESDHDVFVDADEGRILQVIYNLINNAVNYTGEDKTVRITQKIEYDKVKLSVTDTGCGIPEDELPLVWERYYKVHDFHKRANMGTGLGLSIVKNILQMHGAQFGVKSTVGVGSTFWFSLDTVDDEY